MFRYARHLAMLLFVFMSVCVGASADSSYQITNYSMSVDIASDGSAQIHEMLVYDPDGTYDVLHGFIYAADGKPAENLRVYVDAQPLDCSEASSECLITREGEFLHLIMNVSGRSDPRLVTYEYRLSDVAQRYEDTGVIDSRFIAADRPVRFQNASVAVRFSKNAPVQAFVHGGMSADVLSVNAGGVQIGPADVYADDYVRLHILFPSELICDAPLHEGKVLASHLEAERSLNAEKIHRLTRINTIKYTFAAVYCVLFFGIWAVLAKKYHLKHRTARKTDLSRLANFPAAFAQTAVEEAPDTDAMCGTLCELIEKGVLKTEADGDDLRIERISSEQDGLYPHQVKLLDGLFADSATLSAAQMHAQGDVKRAAAWEAIYNEYCNQVVQDMFYFGLTYRNENLIVALNALIVLPGVAVMGYILLAGESMPLLGIGMLLMMFFLLRLMGRIRTLTDKGEELALSASALREQGLTEETAHLLPHAAALSLTKDHPFCVRMEYLRTALRDAHNHNASLPR